MHPKFFILAAALVALGVFGVALLQQPSTSYTAPAAVSTNDQGAPQTQPASQTATPPAQTQPQASGGYTMAQVAQHNSASSCWAAINGQVYNLTNWINQHPGGQAPILSLCGTDGSAAFNGQHGGQRRPAQELAGFLLGPLAQ